MEEVEVFPEVVEEAAAVGRSNLRRVRMKRFPYNMIAVALVSVAGRSVEAQTQPAITAADLRQRLYLIADDSMMGRETGSAGAFKASAYVAAEFRRLGLEPAGDHGTYFQTVPFWVAAVDPQSRLATSGGATLQLVTDFLPVSSAVPPQVLDHAAIVFAGSVADTAHLVPAAGIAGKFVILDAPAGFDRRAIGPLLGRYRDAATVGIVALDQLGGEQIARIREGRPVSDTSRNPRAIPLVWLSRRAATAVLGSDPATATPGATSTTTISGQFDFTRKPVEWPARNVVGILRGSDPALRNEYVSLSAHHDHVGFDRSPVDHDSLRAFNRVVRPMGADSPMRPATDEERAKIRTILDSLRALRGPRPDSIRNGADDDGSGTAAILEIAESFARATGAQRPRRSILFVSHTGEEAGLLGSRWYSDHATVPIDSIVGEIDQDMIGRGTASDFRGAARAPAARPISKSSAPSGYPGNSARCWKRRTRNSRSPSCSTTPTTHPVTRCSTTAAPITTAMPGMEFPQSPSRAASISTITRSPTKRSTSAIRTWHGWRRWCTTARWPSRMLPNAPSATSRSRPIRTRPAVSNGAYRYFSHQSLRRAFRSAYQRLGKYSTTIAIAQTR